VTGDERKPTVIDANLISIMERIEVTTRAKIDKYAELLDIYGDDKVFMKKMNDKQREIRLARNNERKLAAK